MTARRLLTALTAGLLALAVPAAADAHIQVTPTVAAPGDPVLFSVLVPGEREVGTTEVAIQIPTGVLPFSYEELPGWTRKLELGPDGSTKVVRWSGEAAKDGFVRFSILATTPDEPGELAWKAIQTYDDGTKVSWIGDATSETPAAITTVSADAPRQNAGGESGGATATDDGADAAGTGTPARADEAPAPSSDDGDSPLGPILGGLALLVAAAALTVAMRSQSRTAG